MAKSMARDEMNTPRLLDLIFQNPKKKVPGRQQTASPSRGKERAGSSCRQEEAPVLAAALRLEAGLEPFSRALLAWVRRGCTQAGWKRLRLLRREPSAPPWLDRKTLGQVDDLDHRIVCVMLSHAIWLQLGIEPSPFQTETCVQLGELVHLLRLPAPVGLTELCKRIQPSGNIVRTGLLAYQGASCPNDNTVKTLGDLYHLRLALPLSICEWLLGKGEPPRKTECLPLRKVQLPKPVRKQVERLLQSPPPLEVNFRILLLGGPASGRKTLARALAQHFRFPLVETLSSNPPGRGNMLLWVPRHIGVLDDFYQALKHPGWVFLVPEGSGSPLEIQSQVDLVLELKDFDEGALARYWRTRVAEGPLRGAKLNWWTMGASALVPGKIQRAVRWAERESDRNPDCSKEELLEEGLRQFQGQGVDLGRLERIVPCLKSKDLILDEPTSNRFQRLVQRFQQGGDPAGKGVARRLLGPAQQVLLFYGPSGTGKSMGAEVLAGELGLDLWRVEATALESAYVGESEKAIHRLFQTLKGKRAVVLLDEADSFLMDRSTVEGGLKEYHLKVVNTFLRELDRFEGIFVFTSNFGDRIDPALERRIRHRIAFNTPDVATRLGIWQNLARLHGRLAPTLDLGSVAHRFDFPGGIIRNVFQASLELNPPDEPLGQEALWQACLEEETGQRQRGRGTRIIQGFASN